jgi:hypothetical protein
MVLLARARDGVPQEGLVTLLCAERRKMLCSLGRALRAEKARRGGAGRRWLLAGCRLLGGAPLSGRGPWSYFYGVCCGIETRTVMSVSARGDWLTVKNLLRTSYESVDLGIMLSSKSLRRMIVCLLLLLPAITGISAAGQSSSTLCASTARAVVLYAPESNLERREIETLRSAKVTSIVQRSEQP